METRAGGNNSAVGAFGNIDLTKYDVRYILEVYDHNGELAKERLVNTEDEGTSTAFDLRLIPGRAYRFVVWADFVLEDTQVDLHYNTSNLREIAVNTTEWTLSDESRDAYTGVEIVGDFSNSAPIAIELKRPLGKLRVVTTDVKDMYTLLPEDVKVVYTSKIYTSFNAYESDVVATSEVNDAKTIKISESKYANEWNEGNVKAGLTLFSDYFFAANDAEAINFTLDVKDNSDLPIPTVVFNTTIPVQRNYLTTVTGPILTDSGNITVTIVDGFDGEIEETYPPASIDTNRVIRYTATEEVVPYNADAFGANIVSNTYEDGQGVITFDASVTSIGDLAFTSCSSLTSITIPESVDSIGGAAFAYCRSLTSITIPDSVTSIGKQAFAYTSLTSVTIPDSVTSIGSSAFAYCRSLTSITIPDSVTSIGDFAFDSCHSLTSVTIPDSVISIGEYAFFGCTSLTSITIGNGVTSIGEAAFYECTKLTSITIPDSVTSIGDNAFQSCTSLTSVTISNGVTSIGNQAFAYCTSLTSVTIPDSVTSIEYGAFAYTSLTSVTIPDRVTSIGEFAFYECTSLTSVYCKATTPPTGSSNMFDMNASGRKIYVPRESVEAYQSTSYWDEYASYIEGYDF
ncbi:MAG: leucine-rich repeat domain-containing protein [Alistipes sp.]|nr:leucine-rich repeat domain-containing protein [Alistipes sp.]